MLEDWQLRVPSNTLFTLVEMRLCLSYAGRRTAGAPVTTTVQRGTSIHLLYHTRPCINIYLRWTDARVRSRRIRVGLVGPGLALKGIDSGLVCIRLLCDLCGRGFIASSKYLNGLFAPQLLPVTRLRAAKFVSNSIVFCSFLIRFKLHKNTQIKFGSSHTCVCVCVFVSV